MKFGDSGPISVIVIAPAWIKVEILCLLLTPFYLPAIAAGLSGLRVSPGRRGETLNQRGEEEARSVRPAGMPSLARVVFKAEPHADCACSR